MCKYWSFRIKIPNPIYFLWTRPRAFKRIEKMYSIKRVKGGLSVVYNNEENCVVTIPLNIEKAEQYLQYYIESESHAWR